MQISYDDLTRTARTLQTKAYKYSTMGDYRLAAEYYRRAAEWWTEAGNEKEANECYDQAAKYLEVA